MTKRPSIGELLEPTLDGEATIKIIDSAISSRESELRLIASGLMDISGLGEFRCLFERIIQNLDDFSLDYKREWLTSPIVCSWINSMCSLESWSTGNKKLHRLLRLSSSIANKIPPSQSGKIELNSVNGCCFGYTADIVVRGVIGPKLIIEKSNNSMLLTDELSKTSFEVSDHDFSKPCEIVISANDNQFKIHKKPTLTGSRITVRNDVPTLKLMLRSDAPPGRLTGLNYEELDNSPSTYSEVIDPLPVVNTAEWLRTSWPEEYNDWLKTMHVIVQRTAPDGWYVGGFSLGAYQGAFWLCQTDPIDVFDQCVHEQSHIKLRYIQEFSQIIKDGQNNERFQVPWRTDLRPISGIYEGVYVNSHSAIAISKLVDSGFLDSDLLKGFAERHKLLVDHVSIGNSILKANAKFTTQGADFIDWTDSFISKHSKILY